ncbi:MAG: glycosyltransferase [Syntrophobacteraceae bacterium]
MENKAVKVDLHVHSRYSQRPSQWILKKLGCPESFTEPLQLYRLAKRRGMTFVTITDHNTIGGALEIAHLSDVFVSEEVTTYFPEDECKVHVLVYDIDERIHTDIQKLRENIYDLSDYLHREGIVHSLAHPLYSVNGRLTSDHFERLLLLFKHFELNGARDAEQNECLWVILSNLGEEDIGMLADKHGLEPRFPEPWKKLLTGGSDDHSSLGIACTHSQVSGAKDIASFLDALNRAGAEIQGRSGTPLTLAHNLYGIAYQFYKNRFQLDRVGSRDVFLRFLDRFLEGDPPEGGLWAKLHLLWRHRVRARVRPTLSRNMLELLKEQAQSLIVADPALKRFLDGDDGSQELDRLWFRFVNQVSNRTLPMFAEPLLDHLSGANVLNIFQSLGSAGGLYSLLAPYFVAFSIFSSQRRFCDQMMTWFQTLKSEPGLQVSYVNPADIKVAHFTDTFHEINGVSRTLKQQVLLSLKGAKDLTVITCSNRLDSALHGVRNFKPVGVYELPEYPEQRLHYPPLLEMIRYCYEKEFTHIHSATPGPVGLAALAIARILGIPIFGTYHTALPEYAQYLTDDQTIEGMMWKYTAWYYDQMDKVFVPSQSTAADLVEKGLAPDKIRIFPRGIDIERFHPSKRSRILEERYRVNGSRRLLYVGRVSKEKNLALLERAFRSLVATSREDLTLVVVGDGPYRSRMEKNLRDLPCVFTGTLEGDDLPAVYASCDLFVFPSTTDTFGNVVLEAQASGVPVVVTNLGGPSENVIHGKTGWVVSAADPVVFRDAIQKLIRDPEGLTRMGLEARRYMEGRSFEKAFDETWELYKTVRSGSSEPFDMAV